MGGIQEVGEPTLDSSSLQREDREHNLGMGPQVLELPELCSALEQSMDMSTATSQFTGPCSQRWMRTSGFPAGWAPTPVYRLAKADCYIFRVFGN